MEKENFAFKNKNCYMHDHMGEEMERRSSTLVKKWLNEVNIRRSSKTHVLNIKFLVKIYDGDISICIV